MLPDKFKITAAKAKAALAEIKSLDEAALRAELGDEADFWDTPEGQRRDANLKTRVFAELSRTKAQAVSAKAGAGWLPPSMLALFRQMLLPEVCRLDAPGCDVLLPNENFEIRELEDKTLDIEFSWKDDGQFTGSEVVIRLASLSGDWHKDIRVAVECEEGFVSGTFFLTPDERAALPEHYTIQPAPARS